MNCRPGDRAAHSGYGVPAELPQGQPRPSEQDLEARAVSCHVAFSQVGAHVSAGSPVSIFPHVSLGLECPVAKRMSRNACAGGSSTLTIGPLQQSGWLYNQQIAFIWKCKTQLQSGATSPLPAPPLSSPLFPSFPPPSFCPLVFLLH